MTRILVVDDEPAVRFGIRRFLERRGFQVREAPDCAGARTSLQAQPPDAAIIDYRLPDGDAFDLLSGLKARHPAVPVIVLTGHGSIELAVQAMKQGADDFLTKPVELDCLSAVLSRALRHGDDGTVSSSGPLDPFLGTSPAIRRLAEQAQRVARADSPVLLLGETGTGKGVLARWLHAHGPRADHPLVDLNCAGLSRELLESELFGHARGAFTGATNAKMGLFEAADRGTLFLDEIGDLDPVVQPKLLKILEDKSFRRLGEVREREADVRLIAATHQHLAEQVEAGDFRRDLFFRINTFSLTLPPLRDRRQDIPQLADLLLDNLACGQDGRRPALSQGARDALQGHTWPGNIRELRNVLERALWLTGADTLEADDLPFEDSTTPPPRAATNGATTLVEAEQHLIEATLLREGGNVTAASRRLDIPRSTLYEKIRRYGIDLSRN